MGRETPRRIVPSSTAMLRRHSLTRPAVAGTAISSVFIAWDLFQVRIQGEDEPNSFFMASHPTRFQKNSRPETKGPTKAWNWFHTLAERKLSVKSESLVLVRTNKLDWFSTYLPQACVGPWSLFVEDTSVVLVC